MKFVQELVRQKPLQMLSITSLPMSTWTEIYSSLVSALNFSILLAFGNFTTLHFLDSRMNFPRDCGPTTQNTLIRDAGKHCTDLSQKLDGNISFSAIALVGTK